MKILRVPGKSIWKKPVVIVGTIEGRYLKAPVLAGKMDHCPYRTSSFVWKMGTVGRQTWIVLGADDVTDALVQIQRPKQVMRYEGPQHVRRVGDFRVAPFFVDVGDMVEWNVHLTPKVS